MTSGALDRQGPDVPTRSASRGARRAWVVFGRETAYVAGIYLRRAIMFCGIAMAIVLALDVATNMTLVLTINATSTSLEGFVDLAGYTALRAAFVIPSILPIAAVMGVIWAEFGLSRTYERVMVFGSGRAPLWSLAPALLVGALIGAAQFAALSFARPYSTEIQAVMEYRGYGPRYARSETENAEWFVADDVVFNARIEFGPPVVLHDVVVYHLAPSGRLESIVRASRASPSSQAGHWTFRNGTTWTFGWTPGAATGWTAASEVDFDTMELPISFNPVWAEYIGILPRLLPMGVLHNLATSGAAVPDGVVYQTAYQQRYAAVLTSIAMALVGASLSLIMFSPHVPPTKLLQIVVIGYAVHVSSTVLKLLGEHSLIPLVLAIWLLPIGLIVGSFLVLHRHDRSVQNVISSRMAQPPAAPT